MAKVNPFRRFRAARFARRLSQIVVPTIFSQFVRSVTDSSSISAINGPATRGRIDKICLFLIRPPWLSL
jgi:hypothetical protein